MKRRVVAGAALAVAAAGGAVVATRDDAAPARAASPAATALGTVERVDLVDRQSVAGTLGYADRGTIAAGRAGTLTRVRADGATVRRGEWLYEIDGARTGWLLRGRRPAWRDFAPGMSDGADVRQLEANLAALGYEPGEVDGDWTADTTAAVKRFQDARGLTEDGSIGRGEVVFRDGDVRVGEPKAPIGRGVQPGAEVLAVASTRREVIVDLDADRQGLVQRGAAVEVELPDGEIARGRVAEVGSVATAGSEDKPPTIAVRVTLRGAAARRSGLDQAPVDVGFERERAEAALTVPVNALLAREGGGFAVEVSEAGRTRLVAVQPGLFADGRVQVDGDLREGQRVVVPA